MATKEYKNKLTLDGRLKLVPGVTAAKVTKVKELTEAHLQGDRVATATLQEVMTTSDAVFNVAHLATLNSVPDYDEAPRQWQKIANVRPVSDLSRPSRVSLFLYSFLVAIVIRLQSEPGR